MAVSFGCHCEERKKPPHMRRWVVLHRRCNYSAFNGYHYTPSDYSSVWCWACGAVGRTKAEYVDYLRDMTDEEVRTCREDTEATRQHQAQRGEALRSRAKQGEG
jgi:hypothetical protein